MWERITVNTCNKIVLIALTTLYGSAQLLGSAFNFFNDTDAKILIIDSQRVTHMIAPNTKEEVFGAIDSNGMQIFELKQGLSRLGAQYVLFEEGYAVDGESLPTVPFSVIKIAADNAYSPICLSLFKGQVGRMIKQYRKVSFSIEGSTQKLTVLRIS